jgi:hypothetical protein
MAWCLLLMPLTPKKTCQQIVESHNHYLGALKGNQSGLLKEVKANFQVEDTYTELSKGHGRIQGYFILKTDFN